MKIAVIMVLCAAAAAAQNPLFAQVGDPFPDGVGQVFGAADYEGDGDVDLFTTSGVFLNTLGFFTAGPTMPTGFHPGINVWAIAVAEATGDARTDILFAGGGGPTGLPLGLSLFSAPPPGGTQFTSLPGAFMNPTLIKKFAAADFDGDGDVDVTGASSSLATPQWQLYLNGGAGVYGIAPALQWPAGPIAATWIGAGDFDGDGDVDIVATHGSGAVWRRNLGGASFSSTIALASTLAADQGAIGDFDGDGDDDVFLVAINGNEVIHQGSPAGLTAGSTTFGGILGPPPVAFDLEGDGDADVIRTVVSVSGSASGPLQVRLGGPAGLAPAVTVSQATFGLGNPFPYPGIAPLDVEGDGDTDVALVTGAGAPALVVNGAPSGFLVVPRPLPFGTSNLYAQPQDVDGDGDADLVRASLANGVVSLSLSRNDGRGNFADPVPAGSHAGLLGRAIWADHDLDGDPDLWVATFGLAATATALVNDGTGFFTVATTSGLAGPVGTLGASDFDGDGDVDVIMGRVTSGTFPPTFHQPVLIRSLFTQSGIVSFAAPVVFGIHEAIRDLAVLDAEPDGDLDVLAGTIQANGAPATPRLFINDGVGGFGAGFPIVGAAASTVAAADLDGNTSVDLVLGGQVWMAIGGNLVPTSTHAPPLNLIALADFDLDGVLDLLDSGGLWYPGFAGGIFAAPIAITPQAPGGAVAFAEPKPAPIDLDGDGDLDLAGPDNRLGSSSAMYFNLTRHAGRTSLVSQSSTVSLAVWGAPGAPFALAASAPFGGPLPLPPYGTLFLHLPSITVFASGAIPASGRFDFSAFLGPTLPGTTLSCQALVGGALTNGFDASVLP